MVGAFLFDLTLYTRPMPQPYAFSTHIEAACAKQFRTFADLAEELGVDVHELMSKCNGEGVPSKALVKGLARQLNIDESVLEKLAEEVRKHLRAK